MVYTIYTYPQNPNADKALIAAEYVGEDIKVAEVQLGKSNKTEEFLTMNPLGKVPTLLTEDGAIFESNAIARFIARKKPEAGLYGSSDYEAGLVDQWIDFGSMELYPPAAMWIYPVLGFAKYNKATYKNARDDVMKVMDILESHFIKNTFLVGQRITLADIALVCNFKRLFDLVLDMDVQGEYPSIVRWYLTCRNQPQFVAVMGEPIMCDVEQKADDGKKKKEKKKKENKKKKAENPLDMLPKSASGMDMEWLKRHFSNSSFEDAKAEFYEKWDAEGFSIYESTYKFNDDNNVLFMTSNLVDGYIQRLDALRKYGFGAMCIYGSDDGPFTIKNVWIFRGVGVPNEMTECSDSEWYSFDQLDVSAEGAARERFEMIWNGEEIDGLKVQERKFYK
jgi:elongation factor 1-gamma